MSSANVSLPKDFLPQDIFYSNVSKFNRYILGFQISYRITNLRLILRFILIFKIYFPSSL